MSPPVRPLAGHCPGGRLLALPYRQTAYRHRGRRPCHHRRPKAGGRSTHAARATGTDFQAVRRIRGCSRRGIGWTDSTRGSGRGRLPSREGGVKPRWASTYRCSARLHARLPGCTFRTWRCQRAQLVREAPRPAWFRLRCYFGATASTQSTPPGSRADTRRSGLRQFTLVRATLRNGRCTSRRGRTRCPRSRADRPGLLTAAHRGLAGRPHRPPEGGR